MRSLSVVLACALAACGPTATSPQPVTPTDPQPVDPPSERAFEIVDNRLVLPGPLVYADDDMTLDEGASDAALQHILAFLNERPDVTRLRIEGHNAGSGDDGDVMKSGEKAWKVGAWLRERGIECTRLIIAGFGGTKPISSDPAQNPRVEIVVAALRGRAIGGMPEDGGAPAAVDSCPEE